MPATSSLQNDFHRLLSDLESAWPFRPYDDSSQEYANWEASYTHRLRLVTHMLRKKGDLVSSPFIAKMLTIWNQWVKMRRHENLSPEAAKVSVPYSAFDGSTPRAVGVHVDENFHVLELLPNARWWLDLSKTCPMSFVLI